MLIAPVKPFFRPDPRGWCREHDGRVCVGIDRQRGMPALVVDRWKDIRSRSDGGAIVEAFDNANVASRAPVCLQCPQTGRAALPGAGSRSTPAPSRSPPSAAAYAGSAVWISDAVSATMDDSLSRRRIALAREGSQVFAAALACASARFRAAQPHTSPVQQHCPGDRGYQELRRLAD